MPWLFFRAAPVATASARVSTAFSFLSAPLPPPEVKSASGQPEATQGIQGAMTCCHPLNLQSPAGLKLWTYLMSDMDRLDSGNWQTDQALAGFRQHFSGPSTAQLGLASLPCLLWKTGVGRDQARSHPAPSGSPVLSSTSTADPQAAWEAVSRSYACKCP